MKYFVYIIESLQDGTYYKGFTTDYENRLREHNDGQSRFTSTKLPWKIVYVEAFATKRQALIREKQLKRSNKEYLHWLIQGSSNLLNKK